MSTPKEKQDLIDQMIDLLSRVETEYGFQTHKATMQNVKEFREDYNGSALDLFLVADRLNKIGDTLLTKELKENAHEEFKLRHGDKKAEHKGNAISPVEGYYKYDYPQDKFLSKYEEEKEQIKERIKPFKEELDYIKDSIKRRQKELEEEGKAELKSSSKYLRVNRS